MSAHAWRIAATIAIAAYTISAAYIAYLLWRKP